MKHIYYLQINNPTCCINDTVTRIMHYIHQQDHLIGGSIFTGIYLLKSLLTKRRTEQECTEYNQLLAAYIQDLKKS